MQQHAYIEKVKDRCGSDFKPLISTMHSFRLPKANTRSSRLWFDDMLFKKESSSSMDSTCSLLVLISKVSVCRSL